MKIEVAKLTVTDQKSAHRFYVEVLGFKDFVCLPSIQTYIVLSPDDEHGARLSFEPRMRYGGAPYWEAAYDAGEAALVLGTKDLAAEVARLEAKGVRIVQPLAKTDYGFSAMFDDSFGNLVQIYQVRPDLPSMVQKD